MKKHPDWIRRLEDLVYESQDKPFEWATHNCCTFSGQCFEAVTGVNPLPKTIAKTKAGALGILKKFGGGGIDEAMDRVAAENSLEEVPPLMAQRGDPCIVDIEGVRVMSTMGLNGKDVIVLNVDGSGLAKFDAKSISRAWRIS